MNLVQFSPAGAKIPIVPVYGRPMFANRHVSREGIEVDLAEVLPKRDVERARVRLAARLVEAGYHPRNVATLLNCHIGTVYRALRRVPPEVRRRDDRLFEVA